MKKNDKKPGGIPHLFLTPNEAKAVGLGLVKIIDDVERVHKDPEYPWTPESRRMFREMLEAAYGAKAKIEKLSGEKIPPLPDLEPGEETDYLTKES